MSIRKLALSLCVSAAFVPALAQTKPDFTGAWKQKDTGTNGPYGIVFKIEHKDPAFKYTATGRTSDGTSFSESTSSPPMEKAVTIPRR